MRSNNRRVRIYRSYLTWFLLTNKSLTMTSESYNCSLLKQIIKVFIHVLFSR